MADGKNEHNLATRCIHAGDTVDAGTGADEPGDVVGFFSD